MPSIPSQLLENMSASEAWTVQNWWSNLGDDAQQEIASLWDARREKSFFSFDRDEFSAIRRNPPPVVVSGRFVEKREQAVNEDWNSDLYEYLVNHPEVTLLSLMGPPVFHICTAHEKTREALKQGIIPSDFSCPFDSGECPMKAILECKSGKSLFLFGT